MQQDLIETILAEIIQAASTRHPAKIPSPIEKGAIQESAEYRLHAEGGILMITKTGKTIRWSRNLLQKPTLHGGNSVMRGLKVSMHHVFFVSGLTLALGAGTAGLNAQQYPTNSNPTTVNGQATAGVQAQNPNPDLTQAEVARMDQFLDDHQNIEKDLNKNPSLLNDTKYLDHHKDLQSFLNSNPRVREEAQENPRYFMDRETRFDVREDSRDSSLARNPNPDLTRGELVNFDGFLDSHPEISRQLDANPSLINDSGYLRANPELQAYLTQHPQVREEITETPNYFINRENRLEARQNGQFVPNPNSPNPNSANAQEEGRMDQYLADHKDVDRDLRKNPRLVDNSGYLKKHRDLDAFLRANPNVRVTIVSNPNYFQDRDRARFAFSENARFDANGGRQLSRDQSDRMDAFMDKHQKIAKDLDHNPSLCNDRKYLDHHKDLRDFFAKNPDVHRELAQNHSYFESRHQRFEQRGAVPNSKPSERSTKPDSKSQQQAQPATPATPATPAKPATPPVDQRQNMTPNTTH